MKDLKQNAPLLIVIAIGIGSLLLLGGGYFAYNALFNAPAAEETTDDRRRRRIEAPVNEIPVAARPYISIEPAPVSREVVLVVETLNKDAESAEYELEYQSGSQVQGAIGQLAIDDLPARTNVLLGSCSAGGACTYHEDVSVGTLRLSFAGTEDYVLEQDWNYIENTEGDTTFTSRNDAFSIAGETLADISHAIVYQSPGLPEPIDSTLANEAFAVRYDSEPLGEELTVRFAETNASTIYGWDCDVWQPFEVTMEDGAATATVPALELYIAAE